MQFLDLTLADLAANLALDEALLLEAEADRGEEVLRLWEWPAYGVVLGAGCRLSEDVDIDRCQADEVPVVRRSSGGGTVLLGPGCLLYSVILNMERAPELRSIAGSNAYILERVAMAVRGLVPEVAPAGTSDLTADGRKFSGNAQQRKARHLLHHGTLLYDFDLVRLPWYLRMPARQPDYRQARAHVEFVRNLPTDRATLTDRLRQAWAADQAAPGWPIDRVRLLIEEKYGRDDWHRRR
jgi:lipoate-protein ligase A